MMSACNNILKARALEEVDHMIDVKCGLPVENLLRRIATSFPVAQVIITGYYPSFSEGRERISSQRLSLNGSSITNVKP